MGIAASTSISTKSLGKEFTGFFASENQIWVIYDEMDSNSSFHNRMPPTLERDLPVSEFSVEHAGLLFKFPTHLDKK